MKKILCALLALLMLAGSFSLSAFALEDSSGEESAAPAESEEPTAEPSSDAESEEPAVEPSSDEESVAAPSSDAESEESVEEPSSDAESEESSAEDTSEEVEQREIQIRLIGEGRISVLYNGRPYSKITESNGCTIEVPVGEDATFEIIPADEYAVSEIAVITTDEYSADPAGATVTINQVSRSAFVEITLAEAEFVPVNVTVLEGEDGNTNGSFSGLDDCAVGTKYNLSLRPDEGYGVKSVTVNGSLLASFPLVNGTVSILIEEETEIEIEYSPLYEINLRCGIGGTVSIAGIEVANGDYIMAPQGREITVSVTPDEGNTVKTIKLSNKGTTVNNRAEYSFTVSGNEVVDVSFDEADVAYIVRTRVVGDVGGAIFPDKPQTVYEGNSIDISFVPDEGYTIEYVRVNGVTWTVTGEMVTITNVTEDKTVSVKFISLEESSEEESEDGESSELSEETEDTPESEDGADNGNGPCDAESIKKLISNTNDGIKISFKNNTVVTADGIRYINEQLAAQNVYIGEADKYYWYFPAGSKLPADRDVDFGVIFGGEYEQDAKSFFEQEAEKNGFGDLCLLHVQRKDVVSMPEDAVIRINVVGVTEEKAAQGDNIKPFVEGENVEWIKHDPNAKENAQKYKSYINDHFLKLDEAGWVSVPMDGEYGIFINRIKKTSTITVTFNSANCFLSTYGTRSQGDNGTEKAEILQVSGTEFVIKIRPKSGYCFSAITSKEFSGAAEDSRIKLFDKDGKELSGGCAGYNGDIVLRIDGVSRDGNITVEMAEAEATDDERDSSNGVDWTMITIIIVIAIVAIGGGVLFVIKWRQSDDEDDDDDYEDYDDED
ncbi:MAG: hypothetical protein E7597_00425 [Ruminococcaceae bacterium]|nr:hypothetical protein [Oscillospiraceae bacterium]